MPKISIVIPLYNKGPYIKTSIDSVLNQTYDDYEVVIVDDGSTDNSVEVIKNSFTSEKIRIIQKENGGPSSARNRGIQEAKGKWVLLLDADDILLPKALEIFDNKILGHPDIKYFVGNFYLMESKDDIRIGSRRKFEGRVRYPFFFEASRNLTETSGTAIFAKPILQEELFDEKLRRYEDAERQYRLMTKYPIYMFYEPVSIINREAASASRPRKDINEDFIGHMDFRNKSYWEQVALYILALEGKRNYPQDVCALYGDIFKKRKSYYSIGIIIIRLYNKIQKLYYNIFRDNHSCKLDDLLREK